MSGAFTVGDAQHRMASFGSERTNLDSEVKTYAADSDGKSDELSSVVRWHAAETQPRSEKLGQFHLERQHFRCFCPYFRTVRRHARRTKEVLAPLFPGYIFVQFSTTRDRWQAINSTIGIKRLIGTSRRPTPVPVHAMNAIIARCDHDEVRSLLPDLQPGQLIRLTSGPFVEQIAEIEALNDRGRVRVLLDILGGRQSVEIDVRNVGPM